MFNPALSLLHRLLFSTLACALLNAGALADVIVVDAAGAADADYTDLPPALQAAHHNDLILVRAGSYTAFSTHKGVRILGVEDGVEVSGVCSIHDLNSSRKFVISRVELSGVEIENCAGHVALKRIDGFPWLRHMSVTNSADVRASDVKIYANQSENIPGVDIYSSEVELVRCDIRGWTGGDWDYSASGSAGVRADEDSRVRISLCEIEGGTGAYVWSEWKWIYPGDGAPAVHVRGGSEVVITGDGTQVLQGGHGGMGGQMASDFGNGASAVYAEENSVVRISGVIPQGGLGPWAWVDDMFATEGSVIDQPSPADPTLEMIGDVIPGQVLTMRVTGPVGGNVRYLLGRIPEINYLVGGFGPDLLVEIRIVNPGTIPASGVLDYNFVLPGNLPRGMYFLGQASVVYQGTTYRTPSQVVLIR